jgi:outer membrane protein OmpA-like peptidoglycan-associated protein
MIKSKATQGNHTLILGMAACLAAIPILAFTTGCESSKASTRHSSTYPASNDHLVGPVGDQGPAGERGIQGEVGQRGYPGESIAGATGQQGKAGPMGQQGMTGARGPAGSVVAGKQGPTGTAGPAGAQGERGEMGETGISTAGVTGSRGATGAAGERGERGATGARGDTLTGPTGAAGRTGDSGRQGIAGESGAMGASVVGVQGDSGASGERGKQGERGDSGIAGRAGIVEAWTPYRDIWFDYDSAELRKNEQGKVADIADYLKNNPSLEVGIDGSMDPQGYDPKDQFLANRRIDSIRLALENAGVSSKRIQLGSYGNTVLLRDRRVEVLLRTTPSKDGVVTTSANQLN